MECWSDGSRAFPGSPILHHSSTPALHFSCSILHHSNTPLLRCSSIRSHPSSLNLPIRPKTGFAQRSIVERQGEPVEDAEPERGYGRPNEADHQPLPERKPADERLRLRIE